MASLYKRYIPPKSTPTTASTVATKVISNGTVQDSKPPRDIDNKRKRQRTDDEIAERKAKKLRKKGENTAVGAIVQADVAASAPTTREDTTVVPSSVAPLVEEDGATHTESTEGKSEFAHIKNIKKRRKLEKEARKARKGSSKVNGENAEVEDPPALERTTEGRHGEDHVANVARSESVIEEDPETGPEPETELGREQEKEPTAVAAPKLKKRRHKLENVLERASDVREHAEDGDEHLKKHTAVLSKYQKAAKRSRDDPLDETVADEPEAAVLRDLVPLPQPEVAPEVDFQPDYSALPGWLAKPTVVSSESKASFADLGLPAETVAQLASLGFKEALPVQQALIPLLLPLGSPGSNMLPGTDSVLPDVAVSAATGSGKTIAYLLPIIQALRTRSRTHSLKALVVVPTRELVQQVVAVAESLKADGKLRVGAATGVGKLKDEQSRLVRQVERYDIEQALRSANLTGRKLITDDEDGDSEDSDEDVVDEEERAAEDGVGISPEGSARSTVSYHSAIDILVCTPGRLLEHIRSTPGFTLANLEWLVLDEADKLLDQQYDGFLETLNTQMSRTRPAGEQNARERYLRTHALWNEQRERRVRKVILSATMTSDISKLMELRLKLPQMLVVRSEQSPGDDSINGKPMSDGVKSSGDRFDLPPTLMEYCVPVGDGSEKPLYLLELLESKILSGHGMGGEKPRPARTRGSDLSQEDDEYDSDSSDLSTSSSEISSSSSSSSESSSTAGSEAADADSNLVTSDQANVDQTLTTMHPSRAALLAPTSQRSAISTHQEGLPTVLIFTSSNESATRLSHLLKHLKPSWSASISTLTKTSTSSSSKTTSARLPFTLTISTDRAARGLDSLFSNHRPITHVIQYDVPRSLTSYIHRVGRTARAGRSGETWTLYSHSEASWFLREVGRAGNVTRRGMGSSGGAEKVRVELRGNVEGLREGYAEVLAGMREEVYGGGGEEKMKGRSKG